MQQNSHNRFERWFESYKNLLAMFSVVIWLFVILELVAQLVDAWQRSLLNDSNQIAQKYQIDLKKYYPGLTNKEINHLLQATWERSLYYEPYTQFQERPIRSDYVNVGPEGLRHLENQTWPPSKQTINIFVFGGSTTFGYGVQDTQTMPAILERLYDRENIKVYNLGRSHYFSSQERTFFAQLLAKGIVPDLAIFVDGLNDFYYFDDRPLFTNNFEKFTDGHFEGIFRNLRNSIRNFKTVRYLLKLKKTIFLKRDSKSLEEYRDEDLVETVISRYRRNKEFIQKLGQAYHVPTLFVWQPVPTFAFDLKQHPFAVGGFGRHSHSAYGYQKMLAMHRAGKWGSEFVWCADLAKGSEGPHYLDKVHYTPQMNQALASCIYETAKSLIKK